MIEILESSEVRQRAMPINIGTWHWMIANGMVSGKAELIRGVIVEKIRKSSLHEFLAQELFAYFSGLKLDGYLVRKEGPLTLSDSEPEPDISVVPGTNADYRNSHPQTASLVIEVAVSSEALDREMVKAYAVAGVAECWLVLAKSQTIEKYSQPSAGRYESCQHIGKEDRITSDQFPNVSFPLGRLFG
jgi:Uma2 family endonuclease